MMNGEGKGIYFHPDTSELLAVTDSDREPGDGWIKISDDPTLGLLDARRKVEEQGLVEDATAVEWFGMRASPADTGEAMSALICRFQQASSESRKRAERGPGLLDRLATRLKSVLRRPASDSGHRVSALPVPIPVRTLDGGYRRSSSGR